MKISPLRIVDSLLNRITMYKVVLYGLIILAAYSIVLGTFGALYYGAVAQLIALAIAIATCFVSNAAFSRVLRAPVNAESWLITALIVFFLLPPVRQSSDAYALLLACVIAMASKYVLAIRGKHIFNPAAIAAVLLGFTSLGGAIWWVGSAPLLPVVLVVGLLIVRKIRRFALFNATILSSIVTVLILGFTRGVPFGDILYQHFFSWPIVFFASVMVTEPLTAPPYKRSQILYGIIIGALSSWPLSLGITYMTPELALVLGNVLAWTVSLKRRLYLTLKKKTEIARDSYEFVFDTIRPLAFLPGQYLEWTLPHTNVDMRGNRRYFTIASSPTEEGIRLGVKITPNGSSFKKKLRELKVGDTMVAGQLTGDFVLPGGTTQKFVFIAGGIGITPFRSMIQYMIDTQDTRDTVLFYGNRTAQDIAYKDFLDAAAQQIHLRSIYLFDEAPNKEAPAQKRSRFITHEMMEQEVPDWKHRLFYLSGPNVMVNAYKKLLLDMGVSRSQIHTDYFPGF